MKRGGDISCCKRPNRISAAPIRISETCKLKAVDATSAETIGKSERTRMKRMPKSSLMTLEESYAKAD